MSRIVVGVDESQGARAALRWAVREAEVRDGTVVAVLAWGFLDQHPPGAPLDPGYTESDAAAALGAIVSEEVADPSQEDRVEQLVVCDLPARALLDSAVGADLLVVGARGLGGFAGLLLGSVSQRCLHHLVSPTVVVRDRPEPAAVAEPRIVVGIDGSPASQHALSWAIDEARFHRARLDVLHAYPMPLMGGFPYATVSFDASVFEEAGERLLKEALAAVDHTGVEVASRVVCGNPTAELLAAAEGATLLVVGARGTGMVKRLVLGSVADQVAHHATGPVAVIPSGSDR